ncbi:hypothetical protein [Salmonella enterica]|uniref:hypothetical protein n=1 Tax=Salmonella enterica TaxID=28901 RepID=UPI003163415B
MRRSQKSISGASSEQKYTGYECWTAGCWVITHWTPPTVPIWPVTSQKQNRNTGGLTLQLRALGCSEQQVLEGRCAVLKHAIESVTPPTIEQWINSAAQAA